MIELDRSIWVGRSAMKLKSRTYLLRFLALGAQQYARNCAKNRVNRLIGKPYYSYNHIFYRLYLLQLLGLCPIRKVTSIHTGEGAGAQALRIMHAIVFARFFGLTYVHTPFAQIGHADRPTREWVDAWETHFNLGIGEAIAGDDRETLNFNYSFYSAILPRFVVDDITSMFEATIPEFRRKYYSNRNPRKNEVLEVCVHVRRGDVTPDSWRWISATSIAAIIGKVKAILEAHSIKYKIAVLSQGDYADIAELEGPETEFFLDADPVWSMRKLISADILIMGISSFSYVSALLSEGIKIFEADVHPPSQRRPLRSWLVCGANGELDCAACERQLLLHIEAREARKS